MVCVFSFLGCLNVFLSVDGGTNLTMTLKCHNFITYSQLDIIYKQGIYNVELQYISLHRWWGSNGSTFSVSSGTSGGHGLSSERVLLMQFSLSRCKTRLQFGASTSRSSSSIRTGNR